MRLRRRRLRPRLPPSGQRSGATTCWAASATSPFSGPELNRFFDIPITLNEDTRALLWRMVAGTALNAAHEERFGAGIPEEAVDARFAELLAAMKEVGQTPSDFLEGANEEMIRFFASINALESETIARLSAEPAYVESLIEERIHLTTVCVRHILMPSSEALATVVARFEAGEDFAALASEASLDTTTLGGDLGCGLAYRYVSLFAIAVLEAPIGEIVSPVVTQFGFHALIVDQRSAPGDDEVRANPLAYVPEDTGRSLWVDFFNDALLGADIELPSHVGSFTLESIEPPRGGGMIRRLTAVIVALSVVVAACGDSGTARLGARRRPLHRAQ